MWSFMVWACVYIFVSLQWKFAASYQGYTFHWSMTWNAAAGCLMEAILTPFVIWFGSTIRFSRETLAKALLVYGTGAIVFLVVYPGLRVLVFPVWDPKTMQRLSLSWSMFVRVAEGSAFSDLSDYVVMIALAQAFSYQAAARAAHLNEAELSARLAQAELQTLKAQLRPHFLFNSLHTASALVTSNPSGARHVLMRLSDLLRFSLSHVASEEVPLKRELEILDTYLDIERTRYTSRLQIEYAIDEDCLEACVPNMVLQPVVENAIQYGIAKMARPGLIRVKAIRSNGWLYLGVLNEGPPLADVEYEQGHGVGLQNTRARLRSLYGERSTLELSLLPEGGAVASITVPLRLSPSGTDVSPSGAGNVNEDSRRYLRR
jgi:two-component system, LytTR family, sensor kinase